MSITQDATTLPTYAPEDVKPFEAVGGLRRTLLDAEKAAPPAMLRDKLLYRSGVHVFGGDSDSGKTWATLAESARLIRAGMKVMCLDMENGRDIIARRMRTLGLTNAELAEHFFYYDDLPDLDPEGLLSEVETVDPALVVFDSLAVFLSRANINENDNAGVRGWLDAYATPIRNGGRAAAVIDHVTKRGNDLRGAGSKVDAVDVYWNVVKTAAFNPWKVGKVRMTRVKDRQAALPERVLTFEIGGDPFVFRSDVSLSDNERLALDALMDGSTASEWLEHARKLAESKGRKKKLADSSFYDARKGLVEAELVRTEGGRYYRVV